MVVGTPGRLLDLAEQRHLVLGRVKALVLDEADEMLDLGFLPDVERIMRMLPEQRHTMLFSATMPGPIIALSRAFLEPPHAHPRRGGRPGLHAREHHASSSTARTRWTRSSCSPASCRPRAAASR